MLTRLDGKARAGIVTLHPASGPRRDYVLFRHLAELASPLGIAVLSYDRRPADGDDDVPFELQAQDAEAAVAGLAEHLGQEVPIGLWAFSQGAWVAPVVAARSVRIAFLILVGAAAVTPAEQMLFSAAEALRRAGHGDDAIQQAVATRGAVHGFLRGTATRADAQAAVDEIAGEPWFDLLYLPSILPATAVWTDIDFDPSPAMRGVRCPVLLIYGDDEAVPAEASIEAWLAALAVSGTSLEVVRLPRSGHLPAIDGRPTIESVDQDYEQAVSAWLAGFLART